MELVDILKLPQTFKNINRVREILRVFVTRGFGEPLYALPFKLPLKIKPSDLGSSFDLNDKKVLGQRIRQICEDLGPTFIKFGQILATRHELFDLEVIEELQKLHDDVAPFSFREVQTTVESELGAPLNELYASFDEKPLAAASIAQVHRATLISGESVVVKVQRPDIRERINTDLQILLGLARLLEEHVPQSHQWDPVGVVSEFSHSLKLETNFENEAGNLARFNANFAEADYVHAPVVYSELVTTRVLTMEFIDGIKVTDLNALAAANIDPKLVAENGVRILLESVFVHGFFHADPHPGNMLILDNGCICLLDFGMMGRLNSRRIDDLLAFELAILSRDSEAIVALFRQAEIIPLDADSATLADEIDQIISRLINHAIQDIKIGAVLQEVFEVFSRHQVQVPADLFMVGKAITTMEGIAEEVYPEIDLLQTARPYLISIYLRRSLDPQPHARRIVNYLNEYRLLLKNLPAEINTLLRKANDGQLQLKLEQPSVENAAETGSRAINRLSAVLIAGILMLTSALLCFVTGELEILGVPLVTLGSSIGFTVSIVMFSFLWLKLRARGI